MFACARGQGGNACWSSPVSGFATVSSVDGWLRRKSKVLGARAPAPSYRDILSCRSGVRACVRAVEDVNWAVPPFQFLLLLLLLLLLLPSGPAWPRSMPVWARSWLAMGPPVLALGTFWARSGLDFASLWARPGLALGSLWARSGLALGLLWDRSGLDRGSGVLYIDFIVLLSLWLPKGAPSVSSTPRSPRGRPPRCSPQGCTPGCPASFFWGDSALLF